MLHAAATAPPTLFQWPRYIGDFLPYANNEDCYWTGFYSTRPALKADLRATESLLRASQTAISLLLLEDADSRPKQQQQMKAQLVRLEAARQEVALLQHHDGITVRPPLVLPLFFVCVLCCATPRRAAP